VPVSFDVYPRRLVSTPSGSILVSIRRNTEHRFTFVSRLDLRWEIAMLKRVVTGDRSWRVECFYGETDDSCFPKRRADWMACYSSKAHAVAAAEKLSTTLELGFAPIEEQEN
jgi:hypothetical protein